MPTDLSPAEREDRESERLLNKRPAPSRKHTERRAPRHWQRRRRIREDDPDSRSSKPKSKLIDWTSPPELRSDRDSLRPKSETEWKDRSDDEIRDLDRLLRDLDSSDGDDDEFTPEDFDAAIEALTDPSPSPAAEKKIEELAEKISEAGPDGEDLLAQMLRDSAGGLEALKGAPDLSPPPPEDGGAPASEEESSPGRDYLLQLLRDSAKGLESIRSSSDYAASYGGRINMSQRTGAYHGVRDVRGNPTDPPNTGWKSVDKRYFTEKDYDSIVKSASSMLKDDAWLSYGWDGGAEDAPLRAALDLAIQTTAGSVYQSKIDVETYDLLLNRLAKWGHDTFSDTVYPGKAKTSSGSRSSSIMKTRQEYQAILKVASDLRQTDPVAAMDIVKNLRALVSSEAAVTETISEHVSSDVESSDAAPSGHVVSAVAAARPAVTLASEPVAVPFGVLLKLAASSPEAKAVLGSYLLAAKKGKEKKDDKKDDKTAKGKVPPAFLKNMKKGPPKGKKKKASVEIAAEDAAW